MELNEIKALIADLRYSVEELSDECFSLWKECGDPHTESVADYLHYELTSIACRLSDLEEFEERDDPSLSDEQMTGDTDEADTIMDWWTDLDLIDKCELADIPYPTCDYGRGDSYIEAEDRADKWWNSRTFEQKREAYTEYIEAYTEYIEELGED